MSAYSTPLFSEGVATVFCLLVRIISFACVQCADSFFLSSPFFFSACRFPSTRHESIIQGGPNTVLMIRWTLAREWVREREEREKRQRSINNARKGENLTFERKHGSFVKCSLLGMNWYFSVFLFLSFFAVFQAMKLRSHEILTTHINSPGLSTKSASRFKQLFQRKNLFKKKPSPSIPPAASLAHAIPDYVRKSILRFLLEVRFEHSLRC